MSILRETFLGAVGVPFTGLQARADGSTKYTGASDPLIQRQVGNNATPSISPGVTPSFGTPTSG